MTSIPPSKTQSDAYVERGARWPGHRTRFGQRLGLAKTLQTSECVTLPAEGSRYAPVHLDYLNTSVRPEVNDFHVRSMLSGQENFVRQGCD